jgi:hypothetical protein
VVWEDGGGDPASYPIAPGMGVDSSGEMSTPDLTVGTVAKGKGVHREVESEGSRRQRIGPTNRNLILRRYEVGESAKQDKAQHCPSFMA